MADEAKKEETVGEALNVNPPKKEEPKMVPEAVLLEYKKQAKDLTKEVRELKALMESGAPKKEISATIKALGEEYPDSKEFIEKFYSAVKAEVESETEDKLKPLAEKEKAKEFETVFEKHFNKALSDNPEYKDLVNKEVIKSLVKDPKNANKTFSKILEEAYGHLVQGKKTLEPTKPGGGKEDAEIDFTKAQKDPEYFKSIMSDPHQKKKYNDAMMGQMGKYI